MLSCHKATQLFSESQERPLTAREKVALNLHTLICAGCRNFGRHMDVLRLAARTYARGGDKRDKE